MSDAGDLGSGLPESTSRLVSALEGAGASSEFIADARLNRYNDYLSESEDMPIVALVRRAQSEGLLGIASRAIGGEFDAGRAESDAWSRSAEGREVIGALPPELQRVLTGEEDPEC